MVEHHELMQTLIQRQKECHAILENLLGCEKLTFNNTLHGELPEMPGLYLISGMKDFEGRYLRAGRTKEGIGGFGSAFIVIISWETNEETSELNLWLTGFARTSNKRNCGSAVTVWSNTL